MFKKFEPMEKILISNNYFLNKLIIFAFLFLKPRAPSSSSGSPRGGSGWWRPDSPGFPRPGDAGFEPRGGEDRPLGRPRIAL